MESFGAKKKQGKMKNLPLFFIFFFANSNKKNMFINNTG